MSHHGGGGGGGIDWNHPLSVFIVLICQDIIEHSGTLEDIRWGGMNKEGGGHGH